MPILREAQLLAAEPTLPAAGATPASRRCSDGDDVVLLMPDLTGTLLTWEAPVDTATVDRVVAALASLHATPWHDQLPAGFPWTDLRRRVCS